MKEKKRNILMIGKKAGMTQLYDGSGYLMPVTIIEMCNEFVAGCKNVSRDGYSAVQFGFSKALNGKGGAASSKPHDCDMLKELRMDDLAKYDVGSAITVEEFSKGDLIDVIGKTKGKGFQGVMKRHGFSGGPASHGSMFHRRGGSYGQCQWPGHVFKGRPMPGHDGCVRCTIQNLEIVSVDVDRRLLVVKGSFPGPSGGYVTIRRAKKSIMR